MGELRGREKQEYDCLSGWPKAAIPCRMMLPIPNSAPAKNGTRPDKQELPVLGPSTWNSRNYMSSGSRS